MPGFKIHFSTSTVLGVGYGVGAYFKYDIPWETCVLAGGACSISGMLPDIDSDSGTPLKETLNFCSAVVPMLMLPRFTSMNWTLDHIILATSLMYVVIRFGIGTILKHYTVHRGMFHSLPAAAIFAELVFLLCPDENLYMRYFKAGGVLLGFMSHLILDEIWSVEFKYGVPRLKSSFGTALKFWGDSLWANFTTYAKLALITLLVSQDPIWHGRFDNPVGNAIHQATQQLMDRLRR